MVIMAECLGTLIEEGGYEPVGSAPYFAIAGRFAAGTEATVRNLIKEVLS